MRRTKCIGKCILKLANQNSLVWTAWAINLILELEVRCHKVQGMTEAFTDTLYSRAKRAFQFTKKSYLPLFSSETADKFARDYTIEKSFRHALHLVTEHLHRQNQVAHTLRTRDSWLASLSMHFPIHFARHTHEYPVTLNDTILAKSTSQNS